MQRVSRVIPPMVDRQLRVPGEFLSQQTGTKYCTAQYYAQANTQTLRQTCFHRNYSLINTDTLILVFGNSML